MIAARIAIAILVSACVGCAQSHAIAPTAGATAAGTVPEEAAQSKTAVTSTKGKTETGALVLHHSTVVEIDYGLALSGPDLSATTVGLASVGLVATVLVVLTRRTHTARNGYAVIANADECAMALEGGSVDVAEDAR
eukprot:m.20740 g.20740  ORF g.20740 m.20740 type:complete len:137 (-) comp10283_c0_seq1:356-766(-)